MKPIQKSQELTYNGNIGGWLLVTTLVIVLQLAGVLYGLSKPAIGTIPIVGVVWVIVELSLGVLVLAVFYSNPFKSGAMGNVIVRIRRQARKVMFAWLAMFVLRSPVAYLVARLNLPPNYIIDPSATRTLLRQFLLSLVVAITMGAYFMRSERVRMTFSIGPKTSPPTGSQPGEARNGFDSNAE